MNMKLDELQEALRLNLLAGQISAKQLDGCYIGDLLSWVMGRAGENNIWITVMGNVNSIAVAKLADVGCVVLCDNSPLDDEAKRQADLNSIPVLGCELPAYELALRISRLYAENG